MSSLVDSNNDHLELTQFHVNCTINYNYAEFTFMEAYKSNASDEISAKYIFPVISGINIAEFSVIKNNKRSVLKIQDSHKPIKSYGEAVNSDENSYTLEKLQENDMMVYDVGKIMPNSRTQINITYVCKSEKTSLENYWKFTIPRALFPLKLSKLSRPKIFIYITFSDVKYHSYDCFQGGNSMILDHACRLIRYNNFDPQNDIELTYYKPFPQEPFIIIQTDKRISRKAFHLIYKPDKHLLEPGEAEQVGEFIIFLDRSGSMYQKLDLAIKTVTCFIDSLPENCYFNIISFGSRWEKLFECSQKYDKSLANEACRVVAQYKNNMGGTELLLPLESILEQDRIPEYPLNVFIVTDTNVWDDKSKIVNLIEKHKNDARISTIGICTNELYIDWLARMGGGTSQQINSLDQIKPVILNSLKQTLFPAYTNIHLSDPSLFDFLSPVEPFNIFSDEKIEISGVFKKGKIPKSILLQFHNENLNLFEARNIDIKKETISSSCSILVLETKKFLSRCDRDLSIKKSKEYQVEGDYASFDIERYKKNSEEAKFIPDQSKASGQETKIVKRKNLAIKKWVSKKLAPAADTTESIAFRTRSALNESADVILPVKRGRGKQAKISSPL